jgi:hypothetical protein
VRESRQILARLSKTDGLALVICNHLRDAISIQESWLRSGTKVFRYEDMRSCQQDGFREIFEFCGLDIDEGRRRRIVSRNSFERKTWWRLGRGSARSHLRRGVVGDWKNHFCDRLKRLFKIHYGQHLISAGYETDDSW